MVIAGPHQSDANPNDSLTRQGPRTTTGTFTSTLLNLILNTSYYIRSYATNEAGITYGEIKTITTSNTIPTVSTGNVTDITTTTCKCGGVVISQGAGTCYRIWGLLQHK